MYSKPNRSTLEIHKKQNCLGQILRLRDLCDYRLRNSQALSPIRHLYSHMQMTQHQQQKHSISQTSQLSFQRQTPTLTKTKTSPSYHSYKLFKRKKPHTTTAQQPPRQYSDVSFQTHKVPRNQKNQQHTHSRILLRTIE